MTLKHTRCGTTIAKAHLAASDPVPQLHPGRLILGSLSLATRLVNALLDVL